MASRDSHRTGRQLDRSSAPRSECKDTPRQPNQHPLCAMRALPDAFLKELAALPEAYLQHPDTIRQSGSGGGAESHMPRLPACFVNSRRRAWRATPRKQGRGRTGSHGASGYVRLHDLEQLFGSKGIHATDPDLGRPSLNGEAKPGPWSVPEDVLAAKRSHVAPANRGWPVVWRASATGHTRGRYDCWRCR